MGLSSLVELLPVPDPVKYKFRSKESQKIAVSYLGDICRDLPPEEIPYVSKVITNYLDTSRMAKHVLLQTYSIYNANSKKGLKPLISAAEAGAYQALAVTDGSIRDDFSDEIEVRHLAERDDWDLDYVKQLYYDDTALTNLAKVQVPTYFPTIQREEFPIMLLNACKVLTNFYKRRIGSISQRAIDIYLEKRRTVEDYQIKDIAISALLRQIPVKGKEAVEKIIKIIGGVDENYEFKVLDLLKKLSKIGEGSALIVHNLSSGKDGDENAKAIGEFYESITKISQLGLDDVKNIENDIVKTTGNILILTMLPSYSSINLNTVGRYLKENPKLITDLLSPLVKTTYERLEVLKDLDFAFKDSKFASDWIIRQRIKKNVEDLQRRFHVELDMGWLELAKEMSEKLS